MLIGARAHDYGRQSAYELSRQLKEAGFEAAQVAIPKCIAGVESFQQITPQVLEDVKENFQKNNISISVLGCYVEPSLLDREARLKQVNQFLQALTYSKIIGANLVGTETTNFKLEEAKRKDVFEILVDSVLRMVEQAEKVGAHIGIEPVAKHTLNTPELTYELLERVKSDKLKIIFDPVNLLTLQNMNHQSKLWMECFEAFGSKIEAVHAKDVIVEDGAFKPVVLGAGIVEYTPIFKWLNANKQHISILREEVNPVTAAQDIQFLRSHMTL